MQQALLIDEIIRLIFHFSEEDGPATLNTLARTCRAWEGPALDYLWTRLPSITPLLQLIPGVELVDGTYVLKTTHPSPDLTRFHLYACRVKHISHRRKVQVDPTIISILTRECLPSTHPVVMLPSLRSAQLSTSNCDRIQACLSLSGQLSKLTLNLGFKARASNDYISQYLQDVVRTAPGLQRLSIRGSLPESLMGLVSSMSNLQALSLRLGSSLTTEALLAVASFPNLSKLEIHAGHIDAEDLFAAFSQKEAPLFPSLTELHIRAHTPVLAHILENIPIDALHTLRIEAEEEAGVPATWGPVFQNITTKAANTIRNLTIEHHIEVDDMELESAPSADTTSLSPGPPIINTPIPFSQLLTLRSLHHLEKFVLDTTLPPIMSDAELETLIKGWPELQNLDLGLAAPKRQTKSLTFRSLGMFASRTPNLKGLTLPVDINGMDTASIPVDSPISHVLTHLTLASAPPPDSALVAEYLRRLFPALLEVDGSFENDGEWRAVTTALGRCASSAA
ncbi:hypothetical protein C0991_011500 [Blastosporella zonata]|nr:hypothetical protein C0991_011500 [Blastosporella zonata]